MNSRVQYATSTGEECIQKLTAPQNHCKRVISISEGFAFVSVILCLTKTRRLRGG